MTKEASTTFQIGKKGVTDGTIELLKTAFQKRERVKIILLKAAGHTKENTNAIGKKIVEKLGKNFTYKSLGFTIFLQKWRKEKR